MVTKWRSGRRDVTETQSIELRFYTKLNKGDAIQFYSVLGKEMRSKSDSLNSLSFLVRTKQFYITVSKIKVVLFMLLCTQLLNK